MNQAGNQNAILLALATVSWGVSIAGLDSLGKKSKSDEGIS